MGAWLSFPEPKNGGLARWYVGLYVVSGVTNWAWGVAQGCDGNGRCCRTGVSRLLVTSSKGNSGCSQIHDRDPDGEPGSRSTSENRLVSSSVNGPIDYPIISVGPSSLGVKI